MDDLTLSDRRKVGNAGEKMISSFTFKAWQFNWLLNIGFVLWGGIMGSYGIVVSSSLMALGWAAIIQKFGDGEDLIYNYFRKLRNRKGK